MDSVMVPGWAVAVAGLVIPSVGAWLLKRMVVGWEASVARLEAKIDFLTEKDQQHSERFVELSVRVQQLEDDQD